MIANEDIGSQTTVWNDAFYGSNFIEIVLPCVLSVHQFQYLIAATLSGKVNVFAKVWLVGNGM